MVPKERLRMIFRSQSRETNARSIQVISMTNKIGSGFRGGSIDCGGFEHVRDSRGLETIITIQNRKTLHLMVIFECDFVLGVADGLHRQCLRAVDGGRHKCR